MKLYGYKDGLGDLLEIVRIPGGDEAESGVTLSVTPQDGPSRAVFLAEPDARTMVKALAEALGYHLVVKGGEKEQSGARYLVTALSEAMEYARGQRCLDALTPSSLTVALMAERMIGAGWPASLDGPLAQRPAEQYTHDGAP